jgi:hypothetical protein
MGGDDQIQSWRDYRKLAPIVQLNQLLRQSDDSGWVGTRELLSHLGWTNLHRLAVITGDVLGRSTLYVLLPDETVADISSDFGTYETCSVQEFADWSVQHAEPLWDTVVWLRYEMKYMREYTRALRTSDEPKWQALKAHVGAEGFDPAETVVAELGPDQGEETGELVTKDRRRFLFEIPYNEATISRWDEEPPDLERYPQGYRAYDFACWVHDASEGKTSDWIFTRPYDWWDRIKPGWNPPFGKPTFETAEEAALMMMKKGVVKVTVVVPKGENTVDVTLEVDDDPSGQFPMTVTCEQLPNGRWRQVSG